MEETIKITNINDFIFCPLSIYFHNAYEEVEEKLYCDAPQLQGKSAHKTIDENLIKNKNYITSLDVYSEEFGVSGKIDIYDLDEKKLIERKKRVKVIYDGYIFQLYAQYYSMKEAGYEINSLYIYSKDDNRYYEIPLPADDDIMDKKFRETIENMKNFELDNFVQFNTLKCQNCIYSDACDRGNI